MASNNSTAQAINQETLEAVIQRLEQLSLDMLAMHELIMDIDELKPYHYHTILHSMTRACAIDIKNCVRNLGGDDTGFVESKLGLM